MNTQTEPKHGPGAMRPEVADARADFPILHTRIHGKPLIYMDNTPTTQKPEAVIEAERSTTAASTRTFITACMR